MENNPWLLGRWVVVVLRGTASSPAAGPVTVRRAGRVVHVDTLGLVVRCANAYGDPAWVKPQDIFIPWVNVVECAPWPDGEIAMRAQGQRHLWALPGEDQEG